MSESQGRPRRSKPGEARVPQGARGGADERGDAGDAPSQAWPTPATPPAIREDETLTLPVGALVALRKSGGLVFRSSEIVVYDDGRVETSAVGGGRAASKGRARAISGTELAALRRAIGRIDFDQLPATTGQQRPDAFVYELAALTGGTLRQVEVAEGRIPATVAPLLRQLGALLSPEG